MVSYLVWVLLSFSDGPYNYGTITVVDNIATRDDCERLKTNAEHVAGRVAKFRCVQVRKVFR